MEPAPNASDNLDNVAVRQEDLSFELTVMPHVSQEMAGILQVAAVAMLAVHYRADPFGGIVCALERTLHLWRRVLPSHQTADCTDICFENVAPGWAGSFWEWKSGRTRRAIAAATGVQCNGTPTYQAYQRMNPAHHAVLRHPRWNRHAGGRSRPAPAVRSEAQPRRVAARLLRAPDRHEGCRPLGADGGRPA